MPACRDEVRTVAPGQLPWEVGRHERLAGMARVYWDYARRYANRYAVISCRGSAEPPAADKVRVTEPPYALVARHLPHRQRIQAVSDHLGV